jgi:hypothetical protein
MPLTLIRFYDASASGSVGFPPVPWAYLRPTDGEPRRRASDSGPPCCTRPGTHTGEKGDHKVVRARVCTRRKLTAIVHKCDRFSVLVV